MNIAIHQPRISYYVGGGELVPMMHAKYLAALGHRITVITTRPIQPSQDYLNFKRNHENEIEFVELVIKDKSIYDIPSGANQKRWDLETDEFNKLTLEFYKSHIFDLVSCHYLRDCLGVPENQRAVVHLHGYPESFPESYHEISTRPSAFVAVSDHVLKVWQSILPKSKKQFVCYNGVEIPEKSEIFLPEEDIDLLYVGRLLKIKGIETLLGALSLGIEEDLDARLVIVGDGPEGDHLKVMSKKLHLTKRVTFTGLVKRPALLGYYSKAKICIFPSFSREGILTTILEAMSLGKPVITTRMFGIENLITNKENGLLFNAKDASDLYLKIKLLKNDEKMRESLGKGAFKTIQSGWVWEQKIRELDKIYAEI